MCYNIDLLFFTEFFYNFLTKLGLASKKGLYTFLGLPTTHMTTMNTTPTPVSQRATLEQALSLARASTNTALQSGTATQQAQAQATERAAMMALVAYNLSTIRMVPVTHIRLA